MERRCVGILALSGALMAAPSIRAAEAETSPADVSTADVSTAGVSTADASPTDVSRSEIAPAMSSSTPALPGSTALPATGVLDRYILAKLRTTLDLPQIQLPYLFAPDFGPATLDDLSRRLEGQVAGLS